MRSFVLTILNLNLRIAKSTELISGSGLGEYAPPDFNKLSHIVCKCIVMI